MNTLDMIEKQQLRTDGGLMTADDFTIDGSSAVIDRRYSPVPVFRNRNHS